MADLVDALFDGPWVVDGNTAKVKVLSVLSVLMKGSRPQAVEGSRSLTVLDVGCAGLQPLHFWEPLVGRYPFHLTGVDVAGIDRAAAVVRERSWEHDVTLREGSGYRLITLFGRAAFDVVVATQVLEHTAGLDRLLGQVAGVLRPGGRAFFTVDSAHHRRRYEVRDPVRLLKNVAKKGLSLLGRERHYDLPWTAEELQTACRRAGMEVSAVRYYNLIPLKIVHNRVLPEAEQNGFMRRWFALEDALNDGGAAARVRHLFAAVYLETRKP